MRLAPIVLFVYNRPRHTKKTIESLLNNELASESALYIYSDAPRNNEAIQGVEQTRKYIETVSGFKNIKITYREENFGLSKSIIEGVTEIINEYGKIIVLEDDLVSSLYFLRFMNSALDYYEEKKTVWHISGWNYPIKTEGLEETFLWRVMNCWGWGTWSDRWNHFEKNVDKLINEFTASDIKKFNLDGYIPYWEQIKANSEQKINTWAVFWYAVIYQNGGLCLNPTQTYIDNIGIDGSGENSGSAKDYKDILNNNEKIKLTDKYIESKEHVDRIKKILRPGVMKTIKNKIWK